MSEEIEIDVSKIGNLSSSLQEETKLIGRFGVYDTKDDCWLGDEKGPREFVYFLLARIAAEVWSDQLGVNRMTRRFEARELPSNDDWSLKDTIDVKRSALESLTRIEEGGY